MIEGSGDPVRVSVVVPLYNKAAYVIRTLESISAQTLGDFEAIVVDDGSTDGSGELAAKHPDRRFRVIVQSNAGPGAARNRGIAEAQGDFIAFLDADDAWLPEYLENSVASLERCGPEVASVTSGHMERLSDVSDSDRWRRRGITDGVQRLTPQTPVRLMAHMVGYMSSCTTVARSAAIRRWEGFYSRNGCRYAEDTSLWLKVLLNQPVCLQLQPLVHFDRGASQLGGNFSGPRPIEPFLLDPEDVQRVCPPELLPLLRQYFARCACKTAIVLGCWGQSDRARQLVRRFVRRRDADALLFSLALAACHPVSALLLRPFRSSVAAGQSRRRLPWTRLS
jgi:hypothetical protein